MKPVIDTKDRASGETETSFWFDKETSTVHKFVTENGIVRVASIIKYREGSVLEVMKIIVSRHSNGRHRWIYFVPSTRYVVELNSVSESEKSIDVKWNNRSADGTVKSGMDTLVRCNEDGSLAVEK